MKKGELWESDDLNYFIHITNSHDRLAEGEEGLRVYYQRVGRNTEGKPLFHERPTKKFYLFLRKDKELGNYSHGPGAIFVKWRKYESKE